MSVKKEEKKKFFIRAMEDENQFPVSGKDESLNFLISFFEEIRPANLYNFKVAESNILEVISFIEVNPGLAIKLREAITIQLINAKLEAAFTQSGILLNSSFGAEFTGRLKHKILPEVHDKNDILYILNRIFHKKDDCIWVEGIRRSIWMHFFELLQFPIQATDERLREHLMDALIVLSIQIANTGLQKEIADYISPFEIRQDNPFIMQRRLLLELQQQINTHPDDIKKQVTRLSIILDKIEEEINYIKNNQGIKGTSIRQSYLLLSLGIRIKRMRIILDTIDNDDNFDIGRFVDLFKILVHSEKRKNSLREFTSNAIGYIAYQIAEHKGTKGGKYITTTRKEYLSMIISAMWGGFIICFVAIFKNLLGKLHYAHFWQGFWYSINYSAGFVAIDQTGSTLATKQPAFTANAVAVSLDSKKNNGIPDLNNLALTIARTFRSQTASFFGNLIIVFPGTYLLAWAYHKIFAVKIASGNAALQLLQDQHPFQSLSLLYACNTGVFLFLSGIIAGYVQNKFRYSQIARRLQEPSSNIFSKKNIAGFIEKNAGSYAGNISLGFFLGMAGPLGKIFGIPFDIRHITISSGNMAIGVYGLGFENIPTKYLITVFLGVLGVGFFNFLISFSLAFLVAVKSRGIQLEHYSHLFSILKRHFIRRPFSFIFPPKVHI